MRRQTTAKASARDSNPAGRHGPPRRSSWNSALRFVRSGGRCHAPGQTRLLTCLRRQGGPGPLQLAAKKSTRRGPYPSAPGLRGAALPQTGRGLSLDPPMDDGASRDTRMPLWGGRIGLATVRSTWLRRGIGQMQASTRSTRSTATRSRGPPTVTPRSKASTHRSRPCRPRRAPRSSPWPGYARATLCRATAPIA